MESLEGQRIVVTGGSRGLGLGMVEAFVARKARVTVVARDAGRLAEVKRRLGVDVVQGDVADETVARNVLREVRPNVLVLNAGATPTTQPIHEVTWERFSAPWNVDVQAGFHWIKESLTLPLARGSRVLIGSSGAAVNGSPLSGGYAGAKRMLWLLAGYANGVAQELDRDIRYQVIVPRQMIGETDLGRTAVEGYAKRKGVTPEAFLAGFGAPLPPRAVGEHVVTLLTDPRYASGVAFGLKGDTGISSLDPGTNPG
jgi:NAD(P)-dependent dehydrogenase (short-subunit alcohol dehydrogenase family)